MRPFLSRHPADRWCDDHGSVQDLGSRECPKCESAAEPGSDCRASSAAERLEGEAAVLELAAQLDPAASDAGQLAAQARAAAALYRRGDGLDCRVVLVDPVVAEHSESWLVRPSVREMAGLADVAER
jgi:hypothetical protein